MPELPDVEGFKRVLARRALRKRIDQVVVSDARILGKLSPGTFRTRLRGGRLVEVRRHGKHLLARLDHGGRLTLRFGMTGALQFMHKSDGEPAFTHARLDFAGDGSLVYINKRMIGRVGWIRDATDFIAAEKLGLDALDRHFNLYVFMAALGGLKRDAKFALMDEQIVAGIGNIYSDEILFQARIHPAARVDRLTPGQLRLCQHANGHEDGGQPWCGHSEQFVERMPKGSLLPQRKKGRPLPTLPIAPEGLQGWRPHSLLLCEVSGQLMVRAGEKHYCNFAEWRYRRLLIQINVQKPASAHYFFTVVPKQDWRSTALKRLVYGRGFAKATNLSADETRRWACAVPSGSSRGRPRFHP